MPSRLRYTHIAREPLKIAADLDKYLASSTMDPKLLHMVKLRASHSTAAPTASTATAKTCWQRARTWTASSAWKPGANQRSTASENAPPWNGLKR